MLRTYYEDADGDGYGVGATTTQACSPPEGWAANPDDCDDAAAAVNPAAPELCDGVDNNCDDRTDPDCECRDGESQACGASDGVGGIETRGECVAGSQACIAGDWTACAGAILPREEACNGLDDDCDGTVDNVHVEVNQSFDKGTELVSLHPST